jgi:hypothetical protein
MNCREYVRYKAREGSSDKLVRHKNLENMEAIWHIVRKIYLKTGVKSYDWLKHIDKMCMKLSCHHILTYR